jgi:hypothetical protein
MHHYLIPHASTSALMAKSLLPLIMGMTGIAMNPVAMGSAPFLYDVAKHTALGLLPCWALVWTWHRAHGPGFAPRWLVDLAAVAAYVIQARMTLYVLRAAALLFY